LINRRIYADPDVAARKIVELANAFEVIQDGRIYIEKINGSMLFVEKATPAEYKADLDRAIASGWLVCNTPKGDDRPRMPRDFIPTFPPTTTRVSKPLPDHALTATNSCSGTLPVGPPLQ
jgi:hypothetical protein